MCNVFQQNEVEGNSEICIILFALWSLVDGVSGGFATHTYECACLDDSEQSFRLALNSRGGG